MMNWRDVISTKKPLEIDEVSGKDIVYLRKDIESFELSHPFAENRIEMWKYKERVLTKEEYVQYLLIQESIKEVKDFQKQKVLDEYTKELLEEGVL